MTPDLDTMTDRLLKRMAERAEPDYHERHQTMEMMEAHIAELEAEVAARDNLRTTNDIIANGLRLAEARIAELEADVARMNYPAAPIPVNLPFDRLPTTDTDNGRIPRLLPLTRPSDPEDGGCNAGMSDAPAGRIAELEAALRHAAEFLKGWDGGFGPNPENTWNYDEMEAEYEAIQTAIRARPAP